MQPNSQKKKLDEEKWEASELMYINTSIRNEWKNNMLVFLTEPACPSVHVFICSFYFCFYSGGVITLIISIFQNFYEMRKTMVYEGANVNKARHLTNAMWKRDEGLFSENVITDGEYVVSIERIAVKCPSISMSCGRVQLKLQ